MLSLPRFYDESAPDHSCHGQRQPDPDPIFIHPNGHEPLKLVASPFPPQPIQALSRIDRQPSLSLGQPPAIINVVYLLHASRPALKMPAGESYHDCSPRSPPSLVRPTHTRPMPDCYLPRPFQRIDLLALNRDVLSTISSFCPVPDALHFALTCKDAYDLTMPRILADVSIGDPGDDNGPERLEKFCEFMLADPAHRMRHLRALRLLDGAFARPHKSGSREGWEADFSPADTLARLLLQASNLRLVQIRDAEPLFQSHPAVYEALSELKHLHELSLYYIGNSCLKAMSQLRSRPAIIENGLWKDGPRPQGDITPFGPYVPSLRHLKLWECGCMLESIIDRHVWPHVHTLDIGGRIAKVSELAHAFPNLQRLTFYEEFSVKQETGPAVCWPELDYLETSAPIPSFSSPVRRVQLQYGIGTKSFTHPNSTQNDLKTLPLMEKANPVVFSCTISHSVPDTMIERMKASMPSLRYLELVVNDGSIERSNMQWDKFEDWVERNLEIMRTTSIVGLCIVCAGAGTTANLSDAQRRRIINMARKLTRTIKGLEYIGVGYHDGEAAMYDADCLWFRVDSRSADEPHNPRLKELNSAEGARIRQTLLDTPRE